MTTNINELRQSLGAVQPEEVLELLDRLEATEQAVQDCLRIDREKAQIAQRLEAAEKERDALCAKVEEAESSAAWHQRRWMALQMYQTKMREPERTMVCDIIANGELMHPTVAGDRYAVKET